jgi:hypothetical protein
MYQTQLLKIRIRPGKTERVIDFLRGLMDRQEESMDGLRREGMVVESMFLERRDEADYLYYYVKAKDLAEASQVNLAATDSLTLEIRKFVSETWGDVSSPEPLLDLDLIGEEIRKPSEAAAPAKAKAEKSAKPRARRKAAPREAKGKTPSGDGSLPPHALAGG